MKLIRYEYPTYPRASTLDRWFDEAFNPFQSLFNRTTATPRSGWQPAADLFEDDSSYHLRVELPGFRKDQINVEVEHDLLNLTGSQESSDVNETRQSVRRFRRSFHLPEGIDTAKIKARLEDGILSVTLPKSNESKARQISIS